MSTKDFEMGRNVVYAAIVISIIGIIMLFASCSPSAKLKQSNKRLIKVELNNPELLAAYCAKKYNNVTGVDTNRTAEQTEDSTAETTADTTYDPITNTYYITTTHTIRKRYWYYITTTVTIRETNTAALDTANRAIEHYKALWNAEKVKTAEQKKLKVVAMWVAGILGFLWLLFIVIKILTLKYSKAKKIVS